MTDTQAFYIVIISAGILIFLAYYVYHKNNQ